jgi:Predicted unsaturated glucuronyl hydrolase involved in regulation of bacterial surface properties, and related proteins
MNYSEILINYVEQILERSTPETPIWNREQDMHKKSASWNYVNGIVMKALLKLYEKTNDEKYLNYVDDFISYFVQEDGSILTYSVEEYNLDHLCGGPVLLTLYEITKKEKFKKAADLLRSQLTNHMRTEKGSFWHKQIYQNQVWLDGLYMAQPFYMRYEVNYNGAAGSYDSFKQFENVVRFIKDEETGLYYHAYDQAREMFWCDKETGLSQCFWLRALGWFSMACVDIIEFFPAHMGEEKEKLIAIYKDLIDSLLKYQDKESKMWYQVVNQQEREGNYIETSGSAAIAYCILKGVNMGYLDESYRSIGIEVFEGICNRVLSEKDGKLQVSGICLVAGLGGAEGMRRNGTFEYYMSEPIVENDGKGIAPLLLAFAELM